MFKSNELNDRVLYGSRAEAERAAASLAKLPGSIEYEPVLVGEHHYGLFSVDTKTDWGNWVRVGFVKAAVQRLDIPVQDRGKRKDVYAPGLDALPIYSNLDAAAEARGL